eukprot:452038-Ditylum_brightwellii.AAC.1
MGEEDAHESKHKTGVPSPPTTKQQCQITIKEVWNTLIPQYAQGYYSKNEGVTLLIEEAAAYLLEE